MNTDAAPVDRGPLLELTGGDTDFANELLREFANERRAEGERLLELLTNSAPPEEVFPLAHRLKGSCKLVGAMLAGETCLEIEHAARGGDTNLSRFAEPFEQQWRALFVWLETEGLATG